MDSVSSGVENSDNPSIDRELEPIISKLLSEPDEEVSTESVLAPIHRCRFYNAVNNSSNPPQDISDISQLVNQLKSVCPTAPAVYLFQPQPPTTEGDVGKVETAFGYVPSLSTLRFHLDNIVKVVPPTEDNASAEATDYENEIPSVTLIQLPSVSFVPWQVSEIIIYDDNVANYYTTNVQLTLEECQQINCESIGRYANDLYVKAKRIRLSSSHFGEVIRRRADISKDFLDKIFLTRDSQATLPGASAASSLMGYQQVMELYKREMAKLHRGISVHPSGLMINPTCPYLAASSDAQVLDPTLDEPHGLLKIIFPNKYRHMNLFEAATKPDFCSPVGPDGKMGLRKTHVYYTQIQGLIALSGLSWCDLVICTKGGVCIERIEREDSHFQNIFGKLTEFYFTKCLPYLADLMENGAT